jgi:hypothetical protein
MMIFLIIINDILVINIKFIIMRGRDACAKGEMCRQRGEGTSNHTTKEGGVTPEGRELQTTSSERGGELELRCQIGGVDSTCTTGERRFPPGEKIDITLIAKYCDYF